jgi:hypothetical protein
VFERGLKAPTGLAAGTSKRTSDAALGARRLGHIQFTATPAACSLAVRGLGKPTVSALH